MKTIKEIAEAVQRDNGLPSDAKEWVEEGAFEMLVEIEEILKKYSYNGEAGYKIINTAILEKRIAELRYG